MHGPTRACASRNELWDNPCNGSRLGFVLLSLMALNKPAQQPGKRPQGTEYREAAPVYPKVPEGMLRLVWMQLCSELLALLVHGNQGARSERAWAGGCNPDGIGMGCSYNLASPRCWDTTNLCCPASLAFHPAESAVHAARGGIRERVLVDPRRLRFPFSS
jgi:hypothetical protein